MMKSSWLVVVSVCALAAYGAAETPDDLWEIPTENRPYLVHSTQDLPAYARAKRGGTEKILKAGETAYKIGNSALKGYKEGQLSQDKKRKDAERARQNAPMVTTERINYAKRAFDDIRKNSQTAIADKYSNNRRH